MKNINELKKELEELSPLLLDRKGRQDGFKVPKHYFSALPDDVLGKIRPEAAVRRNAWNEFAAFLQSLWNPKHLLAGAIAVVLIVAAVCLFYDKINPANRQPIAGAMLETIPDDVLQHYISNNISDFDQKLILETHFAGQTEVLLPGSAQSQAADELEFFLEDIIDEVELKELEELL